MRNKQKYTLFIGRFDPFHKGHKYIVDSFIENWKPVCIAIRDCESETDLVDRYKVIEKIYFNNPMVKIMAIPDIEMVAVGRGVGYSIVEVPEDIKIVSATKIRNGEIENEF